MILFITLYSNGGNDCITWSWEKIIIVVIKINWHCSSAAVHKLTLKMESCGFIIVESNYVSDFGFFKKSCTWRQSIKIGSKILCEYLVTQRGHRGAAADRMTINVNVGSFIPTVGESIIFFLSFNNKVKNGVKFHHSTYIYIALKEAQVASREQNMSSRFIPHMAG